MKRRLTKIERATILDAYLQLRYVIESSSGDARILDNLYAMMQGHKVPYGKKALAKARSRNRARLPFGAAAKEQPS
jgi:hypothetical protein